MKFKGVSATFSLLLIIGVAAVALSVRPTSVWASDARNGQLHAIKDCSAYNGMAGSNCTIHSSSLREMIGATVYYDQALGIPPVMLDSNVVLDAGNGNRALGRCTVDFSNFPQAATGLCTFSDGTGDFAGFSARVNVSYVPDPKDPSSGVWRWDGTYRFSPLPPE